MAKIEIHCPKCNASFKVDESHIGKRGICTKCGERFVIACPQENKEIASDKTERQIEVTQPAGPQIKPDEQVTQPAQKKVELVQPIQATVKLYHLLHLTKLVVI
jgi:predicted Zn finger-like uncharacterized protein